MDSPAVSIVIVTYGRIGLLKRCIASIEAAVEAIRFELILIINESEDSLPESEFDWLREKRFVKIKRVSRMHSGAARNEAVPLTSGEWICFLDDDVELGKDYFEVARDTISTFPKADVFGGPDSTNSSASSFQEAVGIAYSSRFCTGATSRRHSQSFEMSGAADETYLILCNLWIRRSVLKTGVYKFPPELNRNEENVLLAELHAAGVQMVYQPRLVVMHERKKSFGELWRPVFRSGFNRFKSFFLESAALSLAYFVPMFFVYYLIALAVHPTKLLAIPLLVYTVLNGLFSAEASRKAQKLQLAPLVFIVTCFVHIAYGIGSICGSLNEIVKRAVVRA